MKKCRLLLLLPLLLLTACSSYNTDKELPKSDFVLIDKNSYYLCNIDEAASEVVVSDIVKAPKDKKDLGYLNWFDVEDEDRYYLKTQTSKTRKTYLQTISKDTLDINSIELENDYSLNYLYNGKMYAAISSVKDKPYIVMDVYNSDLSLEYSEKFEYDASDVLLRGLVVGDEKIYIVCDIVEKETSQGKTKTHLFEFDLDFNFLNETDLQSDNSWYQAAAKIDNYLYLAKAVQGNAISSQYIDRYDLDKKEMELNFIKLDISAPTRIKYDEVNNNLIVQHERWSTGNNYYSIYNLDDKSLDTVLLDTSVYGDDFIFQAANEDKYYFQSLQRLGVYDVKSKTMREYDLKPLKLELNNGIFFTSSD